MYSRHMKGESLSVHLTMRGTPPNNTMPIHTATISPNTNAWSKPVTAWNCAYAWFTWKMVTRAADRGHAEKSRQEFAEARQAAARCSATGT